MQRGYRPCALVPFLRYFCGASSRSTSYCFSLVGSILRVAGASIAVADAVVRFFAAPILGTRSTRCSCTTCSRALQMLRFRPLVLRKLRHVRRKRGVRENYRAVFMRGNSSSGSNSVYLSCGCRRRSLKSKLPLRVYR